MDKFRMDKLWNAVDEAKSAIKSKMGSETEKKIEEALSNKNWGASSTLLNDLARITFEYDGYNTVLKAIWEALDSEARQWRTIFKGLTLLEHLIKNGAERVVESARDHMFKYRTLQSFRYYDGATDKGSGVRDKAKQLLELLNNNDLIREEREKSRKMREKFVGIGSSRGFNTSPYGHQSNSGYTGNSSFSNDRATSGGGYSGSSGGFSQGPSAYSSNSSIENSHTARSKHTNSSASSSRPRKNSSDSCAETRRGKGNVSAAASDEVLEDEDTSTRLKKKKEKKKERQKEATKQATSAPVSLIDIDFFDDPPAIATTTSNTNFDPFAEGCINESTQPNAAQFDMANTSLPVNAGAMQHQGKDGFPGQTAHSTIQPQVQNNFIAGPTNPMSVFPPQSVSQVVMPDPRIHMQNFASLQMAQPAARPARTTMQQPQSVQAAKQPVDAWNATNLVNLDGLRNNTGAPQYGGNASVGYPAANMNVADSRLMHTMNSVNGAVPRAEYLSHQSNYAASMGRGAPMGRVQGGAQYGGVQRQEGYVHTSSQNLNMWNQNTQL